MYILTASPPAAGPWFHILCAVLSCSGPLQIHVGLKSPRLQVHSSRVFLVRSWGVNFAPILKSLVWLRSMIKAHAFEAIAGLEVVFLGPAWLRVVGLEAILAASWRLLTRPWLQVGGCGSDLGSNLGGLEVMLAPSWRVWGQFGAKVWSQKLATQLPMVSFSD